MESQQVRAIVAAWRKQKMDGAGNFEWTVNAHIFFEGAIATAIAIGDHDLRAELYLVMALIDTQGINPLLAMAPPISPLEQKAIDIGVEFDPDRNDFGR